MHPDQQIGDRERGQQLESDDLPQPPLEPIPMDRRLLVARDHEADPRKRVKGSGRAHVE